MEAAAARTAPGMADWADPNSNKTCSDCAHWRGSKARGKGRCGLFTAMMRGRQGATLSSSQTECRKFHRSQ
jgi:hypothetical protein